ncbi:MAG: Putative p-loop domain-containing nucleoside triphosphate hydrolase [Thermoanaerobacterales bacterium 50_218]|nr:MAG: Putative p-loop domain-containing nucleoside triphosphate hydrolase [Thermoanaerobacterales bacterium 50_218]HAA89227.1 hypothetical protein [Peptococcaceae bacterium]
MRILEVKCEPVGPLKKKLLFQPQAPCTVVYDENEAGKTTIVDVLVNLLFRRSSAQARFQSRRFSSFRGGVKLEHRGEVVSFAGDTDLDKYLGLPPEFSRLPIVRGSDLAFLWSDRREKKAPLIDACLQYLATDLEKGLDAVIRSLRDDVGFPAKTNTWSQKKLKELEDDLRLFGNREQYLEDLLQRERLGRRLRELDARIEVITRELNEKARELELLEEERKAALCSSARVLFNRLEELRRSYRDGGYQDCSHEDACLWAEVESERQALRSRLAALEAEVTEIDKRLEELRQQLRDLELRAEGAAAARQWQQQLLEQAQDEANRRLQARADLTGELRSLVGSLRSEAAERARMRWVLGISAGLLVFVFASFLSGKPLLAGVLAGLSFVGLVWGGSVVFTSRRREKEAWAAVFRILRECGLHSAGRLDALLSVFESYWEKEEKRLEQKLAGLREGLSQKEKECCLLQDQKVRLEHQMTALREARQRVVEEIEEIRRKSGDLEQVLQELVVRTGKPTRTALEETLKEKVELEREMTRVKAQLEHYLGPEEEWQEKLADLGPFLERFPQPRQFSEIEELQGQLEASIAALEAEERRLRQQREKLKEEQLKASKRLLALGCEDVSSLAWRLEEARNNLKAAVRKAVAALWVQEVLEAAKADLEGALLAPLSRAAAIFEKITRRYQSISWAREGGDVVFKVHCGDQEYPEAVLSDGTKAQFLLSLRLALLERLLNGEKGFLVLDDPLLNSSDSRKRRAVEVFLEYVRNGWQVIYLTVDSAITRMFRESGGDLVKVLRVDDLLVNY